MRAYLWRLAAALLAQTFGLGTRSAYAAVCLLDGFLRADVALSRACLWLVLAIRFAPREHVVAPFAHAADRHGEDLERALR